jgi:hypothetical protein
VIGVAGAQRGDIVGDVGRADVADLGTARSSQRGRVPVQVPAIRLKGVGGKPALDGEVIEVPTDRCGH